MSRPLGKRPNRLQCVPWGIDRRLSTQPDDETMQRLSPKRHHHLSADPDSAPKFCRNQIGKGAAQPPLHY